MRYIILLVLSTLLMPGCANVQTVTAHVQNDSESDMPAGNRVAINVTDKDRKDLTNGLVGRMIRNQAKAWFQSRGYQVVDEARKAEIYVALVPFSKSKNVYVPGQTYSLPVYGGNNGTTTTVKGSSGETLGTLETSPSNPYAPSGYQTYHQEGYNKTLTDERILFYVWYQVHGAPPVQVSRGQVMPREYNQDFFSDKDEVLRGLSIGFSRSVLGTIERAPAAGGDPSKDPGCWLRLGISFDEKEKLDRGARIKDFSPGNKAEKAGLKLGDIVYTIAGKDVPLANDVKFEEGKAVSVVANRNGKQFRVLALPSMQCVEDI